MSMNECSKKNSLHLEVFSSLDFEKSAEHAGSARGFYFYLETGRR